MLEKEHIKYWVFSYSEIIIILIRTFLRGEKKAAWIARNEEEGHSFNNTFESSQGAMQSCDKCNTSERVFAKVFSQTY